MPQICIERNTDDETSAEKLEETVEEIRATDRQLPSFVMGRLMTPSVCIQCKKSASQRQEDDASPPGAGRLLQPMVVMNTRFEAAPAEQDCRASVASARGYQNVTGALPDLGGRNPFRSHAVSAGKIVVAA